MPETTSQRGQCTISFAFEISLVGYLYTTVFELDEGVQILSRTLLFSINSYAGHRYIYLASADETNRVVRIRRYF